MSANSQPKISHWYAIMLTDKYILPTSLTATGLVLFGLAALILRSTPLIALGISTAIIGAVMFSVAKGQPKIPPQVSAILLQSSIENISALVEELGLKTKAIYLPSTVTGDKPKALIPLDSNVEIGKKVLPKRLIVKYGSKPHDIGLLLITPGSSVGGLVEAKPDCSAGELESAVLQVLVGTTGLADDTKVTMNEDRVLLEIVNPRLENRKMWVYESIGTPLASIAASTVSEVLDKAVSINKETVARGKLLVELKVLERHP
jgi:hypothetical protein